MTINQAHHIADNRRRQGLAAAGGLLGAFAAASCCILPLTLFGLGVSGVWIGNFTRLAPYQPWFIAATIAFLGYGYWLGYRSSRLACAHGRGCARPLPNPIVKTGLIFPPLLVAARLALDLLALPFL